jgi:hypothetical protein
LPLNDAAVCGDETWAKAGLAAKGPRAQHAVRPNRQAENGHNFRIREQTTPENGILGGEETKLDRGGAIESNFGLDEDDAQKGVEYRLIAQQDGSDAEIAQRRQETVALI